MLMFQPIFVVMVPRVESHLNIQNILGQFEKGLHSIHLIVTKVSSFSVTRHDKIKFGP